MKAECRLTEIEGELVRLVAEEISEDDVASALAEFDTVWAALTPSEQVAVVRLLIEQINHDGVSSSIAITFRPGGMKVLAEQVAEPEETAA